MLQLNAFSLLSSKSDIALGFFAEGLDSECDYPMGSLANGPSVWIASDTRLRSRQTLAILVYSSVGP